MSPDESAAPRILTAPYYEKLDELERRHWWCRSVRRVALQLVEPSVQPGAVIVDAGCGAGGLLEAVAVRWPRTRAFGVDVSWDALSLARKRALRNLMVGSAAELPVAAGSVDVVFSNDVLQHLADGEDLAALREASRVLKRAGILCLRANLGHDRAGGAYRARARHRQYGRRRLAELVAAAGFRIERHLVLHSLPAALSKLRRRRGEDHASEGGLSTNLPSGPVNLLMDLYVRAEDFVVTRLPWTPARGDTQIVLARKGS